MNKDKCSGIWLDIYSYNNALNNYAKILGLYEYLAWKVLNDSISGQIKNNTNNNLTLKSRAIILNSNILSNVV